MFYKHLDRSSEVETYDRSLFITCFLPSINACESRKPHSRIPFLIQLVRVEKKKFPTIGLIFHSFHLLINSNSRRNFLSNQFFFFSLANVSIPANTIIVFTVITAPFFQIWIKREKDRGRRSVAADRDTTSRGGGSCTTGVRSSSLVAPSL